MIGEVMEHIQEVHALLKLKMAAAKLEREMPSEPEDLAFAYSILRKVSKTFTFAIQQLSPQVRDAVCIFCLVLRALDTIEDDTSIPSEIKVPILLSFHRHIYDCNWHFSCGTGDFKVLMNKFHYVSTALLKLDKSYQAAIEDVTKRMGAGMAIFVCKEVETLSDYDEYCHYVSGLVGFGLSKLFYISGLEDLAPDSLSNSMGLFLGKASIIRDYFEDINEIPEPRKFWPRQIWSDYADKLEDFKHEEYSAKALQCLNEMVTNVLIHVEDCLLYMSALKDLSIFKFCAIPQILNIAMLALCYDNLDIFRGGVKMPLGLTARLIDQTRTMSDVYDIFFEFSSIMKLKVNESDPNAALTCKRIDAIQKACISSGLLDKRGYGLYKKQHRHTYVMVGILVLMLAVMFSILSIKWLVTLVLCDHGNYLDCFFTFYLFLNYHKRFGYTTGTWEHIFPTGEILAHPSSLKRLSI